MFQKSSSDYYVVPYASTSPDQDLWYVKDGCIYGSLKFCGLRVLLSDVLLSDYARTHARTHSILSHISKHKIVRPSVV